MTWADLPRDRLLADVSLWSADLACLAAEIARLSPFADSFHFDVTDAHFAPGLLFFPELVRALRPHTELPFHVHLMVDRPGDFVEEFLEAGAGPITVHAESGESEAGAAIETIRRAGSTAGLALRLETPLEAAVPHLDAIGALLLLGTAPGVKGQDLAPEACARLRAARRLVGARDVRLVSDGGIRAGTVPLLRQAGADVVVPGSLVFASTDLEATFRWLRGLPLEEP